MRVDKVCGVTKPEKAVSAYGQAGACLRTRVRSVLPLSSTEPLWKEGQVRVLRASFSPGFRLWRPFAVSGTRRLWGCVLGGEDEARGVLRAHWGVLGGALAEAAQRCRGAEGLRAAGDSPCSCGFPCPFLRARTLTWSGTILLAHVYAELSLALFFHAHFVHLLFGPPCCCCNLSPFLPLFPGLLCCLLLHHVPLYSF